MEHPNSQAGKDGCLSFLTAAKRGNNKMSEAAAPDDGRASGFNALGLLLRLLVHNKTGWGFFVGIGGFVNNPLHIKSPQASPKAINSHGPRLRAFLFDGLSNPETVIKFAILWRLRQADTNPLTYNNHIFYYKNTQEKCQPFILTKTSEGWLLLYFINDE